MGVTQYIGARYVPIMADPIEWSSAVKYEPLTIVLHEGNSYTSRQFVPIGIDIDNEDFWACTGNYNAQVEQYRQEVQTFADDIETLQGYFPIQESSIADGAITTGKIANDAITANKIADDAIDTASILNNAITTDKIADDAVTVEKVANNAIGTAMIQNRAVNSYKLDSNAVTTEKVANNAITRAKLDSNILEKSSYLPLITDGWHSFKSGYHYDASGFVNPYIPAGMAGKTDNEIYVIEKYEASNLAAVYKFDRANDSVSRFANNIDVGHANCMTYNPTTNKFYVLPGQSDINSQDPAYQNCYLEFNADFTGRAKYNAPCSWGVFAYDKKTDKMHLVDFDGAIYDFNPTTRTFTNTGVTLDKSPGSYRFIGQGGSIYDGLVYYAFGWNGLVDDNLIGCWDISTGKLVHTYIAPDCSDIFPPGEIEDISFDSHGIMYINSSVLQNTEKTWGTTVIFRSGIKSDRAFGNGYTSVAPRSVSVIPSDTYFPRTKYAGFVFNTISEALTYAKYHKVQAIYLYPDYDDNQGSFSFDELLYIDGIDDLVFIVSSDNIYIRGYIYLRNNACVRWSGPLRVAGARDVSYGSRMGVWVSNSTFMYNTASFFPGLESTYKAGIQVDGASIVIGTNEPYMTATTSGSNLVDNSTCGGVFIGKLDDIQTS